MCVSVYMSICVHMCPTGSVCSVIQVMQTSEWKGEQVRGDRAPSIFCLSLTSFIPSPFIDRWDDCVVLAGWWQGFTGDTEVPQWLQAQTHIKANHKDPVHQPFMIVICVCVFGILVNIFELWALFRCLEVLILLFCKCSCNIIESLVVCLCLFSFCVHACFHQSSLSSLVKC